MQISKITSQLTRSSRWKIYVWAAVFLVMMIITLALGLSSGHIFGKGSFPDNGSDSVSSTNSTLPVVNSSSLWRPAVRDTWQIMLSHSPVTNEKDTTTIPDVAIFDVDLFDTPAETIENLHTLGKKVICYFSAGSYENWRPDADTFRLEDLGKSLNDWEGENWLELGSDNVRSIMSERLRLAREKGCDGVDPDNIDGYDNDNGLGLTHQDSIDYVMYLASVAVPLNLALGLKNAKDIVQETFPVVQFSVNEECVQYGDCPAFQPFIEASKPVFHIEYPGSAGDRLTNADWTQSCSMTGNGNGSTNFSTVLKKISLDSWAAYCD